MTRQILQPRKIFRLATTLARWDLLDLIDSPATRIYVLWGKLWRRKSTENIKTRMSRFLEQEEDELHKIFVSELGYEYVDSLPCSTLKTEQEISRNEAATLTILFRKLARYHPRLRAALPIVISRMDCAADKRLAASETEEYLRLSSQTSKALPYEINWSQTDKNNFKLELAPQTKIGGDLSSKSQAVLVQIWGNLFFEADTLLAQWSSLVSNPKGEAGFFVPTSLIAVDDKVQNYAVSFMKTGQAPQRYLEHKFVAAYNQLKKCCPQIDISTELAPYCHKHYEKNIRAEEQEDMLNEMSQLGFAVDVKNKITLTPPSRIKDLQNHKIYGKEKEFRNSSPLLFLLLAAMIYALLKYF